MVAGARISILAPIAIVLVATALGSTLGLLAARAGGLLDNFIVRISDAILGFPGLLLALLAVSLFGTGIVAPSIALVIATTPYLIVLVRGLARSEVRMPYIEAYRLAGFSGGWIARHGVLPNIAGPILGQVGFSIGFCLIDLAALSFLGLGVQAPEMDWGLLINEGRTAMISGHPLPVLVPSVIVVATLVCINRLADSIQSRTEGRS